MSGKSLNIRSPEGKKLLLFCAGSLLFSAIVLAWSFDLRFGNLIPRESRLAELRREEKKALVALKQAEETFSGYEKVSARYQALLDNAWNESANGLPDVEIPKIITRIAQKYGLELNGVLSVRKSKINSDFSVLETDINSAADLGILMSFIQDFGQVKPKFAWKKMTFRPEMTQNSTRIFFNGTLWVLLREKQESVTGKAEPQ